MALESESSLIGRISRILGSPSARVEVGIGDDTAVLRPIPGRLLATTDMLVEGVHFDLAFTSPGDLGHKALAVSLSDIASMGGEPLFGLSSLALPEGIEVRWVEEFYESMRDLAQRAGVDIVGGNLARSPQGIVVDVAVLGNAVEAPYLRSGAKVGDIIAATGSLGAAAAGFQCLGRWGKAAASAHGEVVRTHLRPSPRLEEARVLRGTGAVTAMIDISDGLASELGHIAERSKVGMRIREGAIPLSKATVGAARALGMDAVALALHGGEDYELLLTLAPAGAERAWSALQDHGMTLTFLGEVTAAGEGIRWERKGGAVEELRPEGWDHFASGSKT